MNPQILPSLNIFQSIRNCFKGYCNFTGRARRSEFWYFYFICMIIIFILLSILISLIEFETVSSGWYYRYQIKLTTKYKVCLAFTIIIYLVLLIPLLAASTRRLHDIDYTGCYNLFMLIPFGILYLYYLWVMDSTMYPNICGPSPKYNIPANAPVINNSVIPLVTPIIQPEIQPIVYPSSQPNDYSPPPQVIPVAQPNVYPGQQQIPVAQPNAEGDQPNAYPSLDGQQ